ncbi:DUF3616 domain-containing protein [Pseudomonas akapageensis]|uniref:DUF3616 domain-containing protein n=1 Tax=Pseudomonas akapageensis TaxID=2609961 RepID=UPI001FE3DC56|nr:DUF3616 domain-containing protein [Pseudomonas akapageensis]
MTTSLIFNPAHKDLCDGLSAVAQIGDTLWVVNDDTLSLERLTLRKPVDGGKLVFDRHRSSLARTTASMSKAWPFQADVSSSACAGRYCVAGRSFWNWRSTSTLTILMH